MYDKYTTLPILLLKMLREVDELKVNGDGAVIATSMQAQRVFPALEIIEISGLPSHHGPNIKQLIWHQMESPAWPIREKAAKALGLVLRDRDREAEIEALLRPDWPSQNALHGRLLYLRYTLSRTKAQLSDSSLGKYVIQKARSSPNCG